MKKIALTLLLAATALTGAAQRYVVTGKAKKTPKLSIFAISKLHNNVTLWPLPQMERSSLKATRTENTSQKWVTAITKT